MAAINYKDLFDFSDPSEVDKAIKSIEKLSKAYEDFLKETQTGSNKLEGSLESLIKQIKENVSVLKDLNPANQKHQKQIDQISTAIVKQSEDYKNLTKQQAEYQNQLKEAAKLIKQLKTENEKLKKAQEEEAKATEAQVGSLKNLKNELKKAKNEQDKLNKSINPEAYKQAEKKVLDLERAIKDETKANREAARIHGLAETSLEGMRVALNQSRAAFDRLSKEERENAAVGGQLIKQINGLDREIRQLEMSTGRAQRNVGNYSNSILKAAKSGATYALSVVGITGALDVLNTVFRFGLDRFVDFEFTMAKVSAVTGATTEQMEALNANALELGRTTQFTASQVAVLQLNLSKLGFNPDEITETTEAVLNLALATGEDLGASASTVAITLKGFQLEASESARVVDVMAASFSSSALDLDKFSEATKDATPFANSAGISIEGMSSALAVLADQGISGTRAGTALKNIFLQLQNESSDLSKRLGFSVNSTESLIKALKQLGEEGLTAGEAVDLAGKIAGGSLTILANNGDKLENLAEQFNNAGGSAKGMADIMKNTLRGEIDLLISAAEGLAIQFIEKNEPAIKSVVQALTEFLTAMTALPETIQKNKIETAGFTAALLLLNVKTIANTGNTIANTAAQTVNTIAKGKGKTATELLTAAQSRLNKVIRANPYTAAILSVTALVALYFTWKNRVEEVAKRQEQLKTFIDRTTEAVGKESLEVNLLFGRLKSTNISYEEKKRVIEEVNKKYKPYLSNLLTEKSTIEEIEKAQNEASKALIKNIILKAEQVEIEKAIKAVIEGQKTGLEASKKLQFESEKIEKRLLEIDKERISLNEKINKVGLDIVAPKLQALDAEAASLNAQKEQLQTQESINQTLLTGQPIIKGIVNETDELLRLMGITRDAAAEVTNETKETEESLKKAKGEAKGLNEEFLKIIKTFKDPLKVQIEFISGAEGTAINQVKAVFLDIENALLESLKAGEISIEEFDLLRTQAETATGNEILKIQQHFANERLDALKSSDTATLNEVAEAQSEVLDINQEIYDADLEALKKTEEEKKALRKKGLEAAKEIAGAGIDLINTLFDARQADRERELEALNIQEEEKLALAGDNEKAQFAIKQEFEAKRKALEKEKNKDARKQAIFQKAITVGQIIANTATAVVAALAPPPIGLGPLAGIPLAALTGAAGALQLATALAAPIPQFEKGRKGEGLGETMAIVNEKGQEIGRNRKTGEMRLLGQNGSRGAELEYLNKHEEVLTAGESKDFLNTLKQYDINTNESNKDGYFTLSKQQKQNKSPERINYSRMAEEIGNQFSKFTFDQTIIEDGEMKRFIKNSTGTFQTRNNRKTFKRGNE